MSIFNNLYAKFLFSMLALKGDILTLPLMFVLCTNRAAAS